MSDDTQEVAFRYAVESINANHTILPRSKLFAQIERITPQDSFHASKRGNSILSTKEVAMKLICSVYTFENNHKNGTVHK